jgi:hypothetical protein
MIYYMSAIGKYSEKVLPYLSVGEDWDKMKEGSLIIVDLPMVDFYDEASCLAEVCGMDIENRGGMLVQDLNISLMDEYVSKKKLNKFMVEQMIHLYSNGFKLFLRKV